MSETELAILAEAEAATERDLAYPGSESADIDPATLYAILVNLEAAQ